MYENTNHDPMLEALKGVVSETEHIKYAERSTIFDGEWRKIFYGVNELSTRK